MHDVHKWQHGQEGPQEGPFYLHIDVLSAMTGVSRFGEYGLPWHYSKARRPVQYGTDLPVHPPDCFILLY